MNQPHGTATNISAVKYRILYDTLSRFIITMNKCQNMAEVVACMNNNAKYLFDYVAVKFNVEGIDTFDTVFIPRNQHFDALFDSSIKNIELPFESKAANQQMVQHYSTGQQMAAILPAGTGNDALCRELESIWVFPFKVQDKILVATIFSGHELKFAKAQISILKILCESYLAKILNLHAMDEVMNKSESLNEAYKELSKKNERIEQLISSQELIIKERTEELAEKNSKLQELVKFNAHNIREPLSRILGLLALSRQLSAQETQAVLLEPLQMSCDDLDRAIKNIIEYIERDK